jgi:hypothetical protein
MALSLNFEGENVKSCTPDKSEWAYLKDTDRLTINFNSVKSYMTNETFIYDLKYYL